MHRTTGNFYFKLTTAGHLIGEYSNDANPWALPECAFRADGVPDCKRRSFEGRYVSTWYEPDGGTVTAELTITTRSNEGSRPTLFDLTWTEPNARGQVLFTGQAMLNDGMLIGNYASA